MKLREQIFACRNGVELSALFQRLRKRPPPEARAVFMEYAVRGPIGHWRPSAVASAVDLTADGDTTMAEFFAARLRNPKTRYWAIAGLVKAAGRQAYPALAELALRPRLTRGDRAHAMQAIAYHAGQQFIVGLPTDPGYWTPKLMPTIAFRAWVEAGFPQGPGYVPPPRHRDLDRPRTPLHRAAKALEAKLAKERAERKQLLSSPRNWLTPASEAEMAAIEARWKLPKVYAEFLRKFSPLDNWFWPRRHGLAFQLFGAADLIEGQAGYAFHGITREPLPNWPVNLLVIGNEEGDPYALDLGAVREGDAPVLSAMPSDEWDFRRRARTFVEFLEKLSR
jgi:hypothetical protein